MAEQEAEIDGHYAQVTSGLHALAQELGVEFTDLQTLYLYSGAQGYGPTIQEAEERIAAVVGGIDEVANVHARIEQIIDKVSETLDE
ncbi:hypothetical protein JW766_06160 [Candidatus Dojkabacteria bacterium]|nr:hypothetical protein [Candidatus Dojkabacteria bacterium]